jgi:hypothetical protein
MASLLEELRLGITVTLVSTHRLFASILLLATRLAFASTVSRSILPTTAVRG